VSSSGYYEWRTRPPSARAQANQRLLARIQSLHAASDGVLGRRRLRDDLVDEGERCSFNRVGRLMQDAGLKGIPQRRRWHKKVSGTRPGEVRNHLERDFAAALPNHKWVTDITFVRTAEHWLYLCVVIDLHSRLVVGWSMRATMTAELVADALLMAIWRRGWPTELLHHSDQGSQYLSELFQRLLSDHGIDCSVSRRGDCWDNAAMESFFSTLKVERVYRRNYRTRDEAKADLFQYMEGFYNPRRRHSTLGGLSPMEFEKRELLA
jgi:putative transposase